jgi:3-phosphoshikimate 1-carboxyvinyltransferase
MAQWGIDVTGSESAPVHCHEIVPAPVAARRLAIEPDASSAVYMAAAGALVPGSTVRLAGLPRDSRQPDMAAIAALERMGLACEVGADGSLCCRGPRELRPIEVDLAAAPDGALAVAAVCAMATGPSRLGGLHTLRVKETDRIGALHRALEAVGCRVTSDDDSLTIDPGSRHARPALIRTENDHRMAMAFAVLGLARPGIAIENPACVAKSHPGFWEELASLRG